MATPLLLLHLRALAHRLIRPLVSSGCDRAAAAEPARDAEHQAPATQAVGGGRAIAAHLDDFRDQLVWEVTVLNRPFQYEVTVDAGSGKVLRVRKHREDD